MRRNIKLLFPALLLLGFSSALSHPQVEAGPIDLDIGEIAPGIKETRRITLTGTAAARVMHSEPLFSQEGWIRMVNLVSMGPGQRCVVEITALHPADYDFANHRLISVQSVGGLKIRATDETIPVRFKARFRQPFQVENFRYEKGLLTAKLSKIRGPLMLIDLSGAGEASLFMKSRTDAVLRYRPANPDPVAFLAVRDKKSGLTKLVYGADFKDSLTAAPSEYRGLTLKLSIPKKGKFSDVRWFPQNAYSVVAKRVEASVIHVTLQSNTSAVLPVGYAVMRNHRALDVGIMLPKESTYEP